MYRCFQVHFPLQRLFQAICPSQRPYITFCNALVFVVRGC
jgi:hypothetical protein